MNELRTHAFDHDLGSRARRTLAGLSQEACAEPLVWTSQASFSWEHVVLRPGRRARLATLPHLRRELRAIHLWEQIELLRDAAELRLATTLAGRLLGEPFAVDEAQWRERCAEEIGSALASGLRVVGELLACALQPRASWSSALELTRGLVALRASPTAELLLARALLAAGERDAAWESIGRLDVARLSLAQRACWLLCRSELALSRGARSAALHDLQRATGLGAGLRPRLAALALAQELEATGEEAVALERIAELAPDVARRGRALRELEEARALLGQPLSPAGRRRFVSTLDAVASRSPKRCEA